ncbi:MAG: 50S ribosomal protein L6 [Ardenticatenales bacterium]|nr:50S ribosomal protein L6 [Ardenticatenales bacterium]
MSRIGRLPIPVPDGVEVIISGPKVHVNGPKGKLERVFHPDIRIELTDGQLLVSRPTDQRHHRALHGLTRALLNNMVVGVSQGFERVLEIVGVGYRAVVEGESLRLSLGFSHAVVVDPPEDIKFEIEPRRKLITIRGIDKEIVGQVAADIRKLRPPEPYKGKGVRYLGEYVRRKAGKAGKAE